MNLLQAALPHGQFWAILPSYASGVAVDLKNTDFEAHLADYQAQSVLKAENPVNAEDRRYPVRDGVAVIRIDGVMTKRPTSYGRGTSTLLTRRAVEQAAIDTDVKSILIVADSPGGSVDGIQDLHDAIAKVSKPVRGHIDGGCYSAAYWTLCACDRITIGRTDGCGSLGVMAVLADTSEMAKEEGVEVLLFATGELKGQGTDGVPISAQARAMYQGHVDAMGEFFAASIAKGRKLSGKQVEKVFTGALFTAQEAMSLGLVDAIGTLDDAFQSFEETDDEDELEARAETITLSAEQKAALSAGVTREEFAPTISTQTGGESRPSAGKDEPVTAQETQHMSTLAAWKNAIADTFRSNGKGPIATALDTTSTESPEHIARVVNNNIDAQVQDLLANDPLLRAVKACGIHTPEDMSAFAELHAIGEAALKTVREDATKACIAAKGPELGATIAKQLETQPYAIVKANLEAWQAEADSKFGTTGGKPAARQTAPTGALASDVDEDKTPKTAWEKLTDAQRAHAKAMGKDTDETREVYAKNLLGEN